MERKKLFYLNLPKNTSMIYGFFGGLLIIGPQKGGRMGLIFKIPAGIIFIVGGFWGLFICLGIIIDALGFIGGLIAFLLLPMTLYFAPWYAAIAKGNWFPLILVYGSGIAAAILYGIGAAIDKD